MSGTLTFVGSFLDTVSSSVVVLEVAGPPAEVMVGNALAAVAVAGAAVGGTAAPLTFPLVSRGWGRLLPGLSRHDDRERLRHHVVGILCGFAYVALGPAAWWLVVPRVVRSAVESVHVVAAVALAAAMGASLLGGAILLGRQAVAVARGSEVVERSPLSRVEGAYLAALFGLPVLLVGAVSLLAFLASHL